MSLFSSLAPPDLRPDQFTGLPYLLQLTKPSQGNEPTTATTKKGHKLTNNNNNPLKSQPLKQNTSLHSSLSFSNDRHPPPPPPHACASSTSLSGLTGVDSSSSRTFDSGGTTMRPLEFMLHNKTSQQQLQQHQKETSNTNGTKKSTPTIDTNPSGVSSGLVNLSLPLTPSGVAISPVASSIVAVRSSNGEILTGWGASGSNTAEEGQLASLLSARDTGSAGGLPNQSPLSKRRTARASLLAAAAAATSSKRPQSTSERDRNSASLRGSLTDRFSMDDARPTSSLLHFLGGSTSSLDGQTSRTQRNSRRESKVHIDGSQSERISRVASRDGKHEEEKSFMHIQPPTSSIPSAFPTTSRFPPLPPPSSSSTVQSPSLGPSNDATSAFGILSARGALARHGRTSLNAIAQPDSSLLAPVSSAASAPNASSSTLSPYTLRTFEDEMLEVERERRTRAKERGHMTHRESMIYDSNNRRRSQTLQPQPPTTSSTATATTAATIVPLLPPLPSSASWENSNVEIDLASHYSMFSAKVADYTHRLTQKLQGNLELVRKKIHSNEQAQLSATRHQMRELLRFYHQHEGDMYDIVRSVRDEERTMRLEEYEYSELLKQQTLIHEDYHMQRTTLFENLYQLHMNHGKMQKHEYLHAHSKQSDAQVARLQSRSRRSSFGGVVGAGAGGGVSANTNLNQSPLPNSTIQPPPIASATHHIRTPSMTTTTDDSNVPVLRPSGSKLIKHHHTRAASFTPSHTQSRTLLMPTSPEHVRSSSLTSSSSSSSQTKLQPLLPSEASCETPLPLPNDLISSNGIVVGPSQRQSRRASQDGMLDSSATSLNQSRRSSRDASRRSSAHEFGSVAFHSTTSSTTLNDSSSSHDLSPDKKSRSSLRQSRRTSRDTPLIDPSNMMMPPPPQAAPQQDSSASAASASKKLSKSSRAASRRSSSGGAGIELSTFDPTLNNTPSAPSNTSNNPHDVSMTPSQHDELSTKVELLRNYWQTQFASTRREREKLKLLKNELLNMEQSSGMRVEIERMKLQGLEHQLQQVRTNLSDVLGQRSQELNHLRKEHQRLDDIKHRLQEDHRQLSETLSETSSAEEDMYMKIGQHIEQRLEITRANTSIVKEVERKFLEQLNQRYDIAQETLLQLRIGEKEFSKIMTCTECCYPFHSSSSLIWSSGETSCEKCAFQRLFPTNFQAVVKAMHQQFSKQTGNKEVQSQALVNNNNITNADTIVPATGDTPDVNGHARTSSTVGVDSGPNGSSLSSSSSSNNLLKAHLTPISTSPRPSLGSSISSSTLTELGTRLLSHMSSTVTGGDDGIDGECNPIDSAGLAVGARIRRGSLGGLVDAFTAMADAAAAQTQTQAHSHTTHSSGQQSQLTSARASGTSLIDHATLTHASSNGTVTTDTSVAVFPSESTIPAPRGVLNSMSSPSVPHRQLQELSEWNSTLRTEQPNGIPFTLLWFKNRLVDFWSHRFGAYRHELNQLDDKVTRILPKLRIQFEQQLSPYQQERLANMRQQEEQKTNQHQHNNNNNGGSTREASPAKTNQH